MTFWDSSALLTLCVDERRSEAMRSLLGEDGLVATWWASLVECRSALARLRRDEVLDGQGERFAAAALEHLRSAWSEILPSAELRAHALRFLAVHPLRAADSLQLAAAFVWCGKNPEQHRLVTLDRRLAEAAEKEGFRVAPLR
jgi:predicted nucleic acid-binding protein